MGLGFCIRGLEFMVEDLGVGVQCQDECSKTGSFDTPQSITARAIATS